MTKDKFKMSWLAKAMCWLAAVGIIASIVFWSVGASLGKVEPYATLNACSVILACDAMLYCAWITILDRLRWWRIHHDRFSLYMIGALGLFCLPLTWYMMPTSVLFASWCAMVLNTHPTVLALLLTMTVLLTFFMYRHSYPITFQTQNYLKKAQEEKLWDSCDAKTTT